MWKLSNPYALAAIAGLLGIAGTIVWKFWFFVAPLAWTGEPGRLARALALRPGMMLADLGAGSGALAAAMTAYVGEHGQVYATELSSERLASIDHRITRDSLRNMSSVAAGETETGLPDHCCDAIYLRAVLHHIGNPEAFASGVARMLRPGGRVGVIDFPPGALWFHGGDHGIEPSAATAAFQSAGFRLRERADDWGSGMFLLVFERP